MAGVQSIKSTDIERYGEEACQQLASMADSYFHKKKFLLGEGVNRDKMRHYRRIEKIMCSDTCEITTYVKKKIAGQLEDCKNYSLIFEENTPKGCCEIVKEEFSWTSRNW